MQGAAQLESLHNIVRDQIKTTTTPFRIGNFIKNVI